MRYQDQVFDYMGVDSVNDISNHNQLIKGELVDNTLQVN